jgi:hypothetical protein
MVELFTIIFATHTLTWADAQGLLNIMLSLDERNHVLNKANEILHQADPQHTAGPRDAIPKLGPKFYQ